MPTIGQSFSRPNMNSIRLRRLSRRLTWHPRNKDHAVKENRIRRLMRLMGLMGLMPIYQKPNTSKPANGHKTYPDLLRGLRDVRKRVEFYNHRRPHKALGRQPPAVVCSLQIKSTQPDRQ